jgi:hypothetical protein
MGTGLVVILVLVLLLVPTTLLSKTSSLGTDQLLSFCCMDCVVLIVLGTFPRRGILVPRSIWRVRGVMVWGRVQRLDMERLIVDTTIGHYGKVQAGRSECRRRADRDAFARSEVGRRRKKKKNCATTPTIHKIDHV